MEVTMIETDKLRNILIKAFKFEYLKDGGVDNWSFYYDSLEDGLDADREQFNLKPEAKIEEIVEAYLNEFYPSFDLEESIKECANAACECKC